jgi:hypothetical protein
MHEKTIPAIRAILTVTVRRGQGRHTKLEGFDQRGNIVWRKVGIKSWNLIGAMKFHSIPVATVFLNA